MPDSYEFKFGQPIEITSILQTKVNHGGVEDVDNFISEWLTHPVRFRKYYSKTTAQIENFEGKTYQVDINNIKPTEDKKIKNSEETSVVKRINNDSLDNMSSIDVIFPYVKGNIFGLAKDSQVRLIESLEKVKSGAFFGDLQINKEFQFDKFGRVQFEVGKSREDDLEGYKLYLHYIIINSLNLLTNAGRGIGVDTAKRIDDLLNESCAFNYEAYLSNSVTIGKNTMKLIKFLLKHDILSASNVDSINATKRSGKQMYLMISKNPIDFLTCSSGQTFTSCESVFSAYSKAFWTGLLAGFVDPNRTIIYLTSGAKNNLFLSTINGDEENKIVHYKYSERRWCISLFQNRGLFLEKVYPNNSKLTTCLLRQAFPKLDISTYEEGITKFKKLKAPNLKAPNSEIGLERWKPLRYLNYQHATIYADTLGLYVDNFKDKAYYDLSKGRTGAETPFEFSGGIHKLFPYIKSDQKVIWEKLTGRQYALCPECNEYVQGGTTYATLTPKNEITNISVCMKCFYQNSIRCSCGAYVKIKEEDYTIYSVNTENPENKTSPVCFRCSAGICIDCGKAMSRDTVIMFDTKKGKVCQSCKEKKNYVQCRICGLYHKGGQAVCNECNTKFTVTCSKCKRVILSSEAIFTADFNKVFCNDCI